MQKISPSHLRTQAPAESLSSIRWPLASSSSIIKLNVMNNAPLKTATRCTQDTNIQHLHDETVILPIHEHLERHASQFKQKTQHPSHPYTNAHHTPPFQGLKVRPSTSKDEGANRLHGCLQSTHHISGGAVTEVLTNCSTMGTRFTVFRQAVYADLQDRCPVPHKSGHVGRNTGPTTTHK